MPVNSLMSVMPFKRLAAVLKILKTRALLERELVYEEVSLT